MMVIFAVKRAIIKPKIAIVKTFGLNDFHLTLKLCSPFTVSCVAIGSHVRYFVFRENENRFLHSKGMTTAIMTTSLIFMV